MNNVYFNIFFYIYFFKDEYMETFLPLVAA